MNRILIGLLALVAGVALIAVGAVIGAVFLCLAWNGVMGEMFPRVAEHGVPLTLTVWQAWKLLFLIGVLASPLRASATATSKD